MISQVLIAFSLVHSNKLRNYYDDEGNHSREYHNHLRCFIAIDVCYQLNIKHNIFSNIYCFLPVSSINLYSEIFVASWEGEPVKMRKKNLNSKL